MLVYNKASGPLRGSTSPVFVHVGYDGWWLKVRLFWLSAAPQQAWMQVSSVVSSRATACMQGHVFPLLFPRVLPLTAGQARDRHAAAERRTSPEVQVAVWPVDGSGGEGQPGLVMSAPVGCL